MTNTVTLLFPDEESANDFMHDLLMKQTDVKLNGLLVTCSCPDEDVIKAIIVYNATVVELDHSTRDKNS